MYLNDEKLNDWVQLQAGYDFLYMDEDWINDWKSEWEEIGAEVSGSGGEWEVNASGIEIYGLKFDIWILKFSGYILKYIHMKYELGGKTYELEAKKIGEETTESKESSWTLSELMKSPWLLAGIIVGVVVIIAVLLAVKRGRSM